MKHIVILGGGAWGSALADASLAAGNQVTVWRRSVLPADLPAHAYSISTDIDVVKSADAVLLVTPAQTTRTVLQQLSQLRPETPLVICSKGLEQSTGLRLDEVVRAWRASQTVAYLSGPNFAAEVKAKVPTAGVIAASTHHMAQHLCALLSAPYFRLYANEDMVGVGLLGALKNPLAIGAGLIAGAAPRYNLGENTRAAFITRGLAEITRLGLLLGASATTFAGLAGIGDVLLSCSSTQSRNYRFGFAVGAEKTPEAAVTVEGLPTIAAAHHLAAEHQIDMPLMNALYDLLYNHVSLDTVLAQLLARPLKRE